MNTSSRRPFLVSPFEVIAPVGLFRNRLPEIKPSHGQPKGTENSKASGGAIKYAFVVSILNALGFQSPTLLCEGLTQEGNNGPCTL